jgi:hypothetical protein
MAAQVAAKYEEVVVIEELSTELERLTEWLEEITGLLRMEAAGFESVAARKRIPGLLEGVEVEQAGGRHAPFILRLSACWASATSCRCSRSLNTLLERLTNKNKGRSHRPEGRSPSNLIFVRSSYVGCPCRGEARVFTLAGWLGSLNLQEGPTKTLGPDEGASATKTLRRSPR